MNSSKLCQTKQLDYRLIAMEKTSDGIAIIDANGNLHYANKALLKFYDCGNEALEQPWQDIILQGQSTEIRDVILNQLSEKGEVYGEISLQQDVAKKKTAEISLTRLEDNGIIVTLRDSALTKDIEREREALREQLHQAQKLEAVGRLAGGVAHDFNNILAAMNGYAEFLIDDLEEESEQYQFAQNILSAGMQARDLVDQMLAFSRRESDELRQLDLRASVNETLKMLKASLPKSVTIHGDIIDEAAIMHGNPTQLSQALMNLCVNAKDAMKNERGTLTIKVDFVNEHDVPNISTTPEMPDESYLPLIHMEEIKEGHTRLTLGSLVSDHPYCRLSVGDDGSGMSRLVMENIFEPFFTTKSVDEGTGLGLAMVHGVITAHKGALEINSRLGKGTCFDLFFPLSLGEGAQEMIEDEANISSSLDKRNILLVEDDANVAIMTLKMLERLGVEVEHAENGREALHILQENPDYFDLVLTDQNMPEMTGVELIEAVSIKFKNLPFVLLSGYSEKSLQNMQDKHQCVKAVLRKPIAKANLSKTLNEVFK
ncbi:MAG: hybrid sensor histidine kinase/response regulator [Alphaproteobacteria bacterium]